MGEMRLKVIKDRTDKDFEKSLRSKESGMTNFDPNIVKLMGKASPEQRMELVQALRENTFKIEEAVMKEIYREKILTKKEYEEKYRHRFVDPISGADSFPELMQVVIFNKRNAKSDDKMIFVSTNSEILENRKELTKRFKIEIKDPREALEMVMVEEEKEFPEAM